MRRITPDQIGFAASSGPIERYFPLARREGLAWLEFACQHPANFPETFDRPRIARVRRLVERSGIRCGLHSASFVNTAEIMPIVRKAVVADMKAYVDLTKALGCEYLVIHMGFHFSVYLDRVKRALYDTLAEVTEYGERRRVPLAIENMNHMGPTSEFQYLGVTTEEFADLFRRIRSPYLGLALDAAHGNLLPGGTGRFVRLFGDRIREVQLSDNRGTIDEHLAAGEGTLDFGALFRQLGAIDYTGPLIIELRDVEAKRRSLAHLRGLLAGTAAARPRRRAAAPRRYVARA
ncbi:MAG TPA: sugar phosphate isomerase/epimerase family protein [Thermodesulfobacteriota bacterium]